MNIVVLDGYGLNRIFHGRLDKIGIQRFMIEPLKRKS